MLKTWVATSLGTSLFDAVTIDLDGIGAETAGAFNMLKPILLPIGGLILAVTLIGITLWLLGKARSTTGRRA